MTLTCVTFAENHKPLVKIGVCQKRCRFVDHKMVCFLQTREELYVGSGGQGVLEYKGIQTLNAKLYKLIRRFRAEKPASGSWEGNLCSVQLEEWKSDIIACRSGKKDRFYLAPFHQHIRENLCAQEL